MKTSLQRSARYFSLITMLLLVFGLAGRSAMAYTKVPIGVGPLTNNWGTAANWSPSGMPTATDSVGITNGQTIYLGSSSAMGCQSLTIEPGAVIQFGTTAANTTTARTLNLVGSLTNNGTIKVIGTNVTHFLNFAASGNWVGSGDVSTVAGGAPGLAITVSNGVTLNASGLTAAIKLPNTTRGSAITNNGTLNAGSQVINGNGANNTFTLGSGATLISANLNGLVSGTSGTLNFTPAPSLSTGANYTFNGSGAQSAAGLPATVNNLTLANTAGVTLGGSVALNGTLAATYVSGTPALAVAGNTLTLNTTPVTITVSGSALTSGNHTIVSKTSGSVTGTPGALTVNGSGSPYSPTPTISDSTGELVLNLPSLCTTPDNETVSGTTAICSGGSATITLSPSQSGVTYQLYAGASPVGGTVPGTGSDLTWSESPGSTTTYTVQTTTNGGYCAVAMGGSAVVTITPSVTPSVSVTADPGFTTCSANPVTFTAHPVNGGATPSYQWYQDDSPVGTDSPTYGVAANWLFTGETIYVVMTSSLACVTANPAYSATNTVTITESSTPSVGISANPGSTICAGTTVIFTATPTNGGATPIYTWLTNSVVDASSTDASYTNSTLVNGDKVDCQLQSSDACASPTTADANQITMTVNPLLTPAVGVSGSPSGAICVGTAVIFTATPTNGGVSPAYSWQTNGVADTSVPASSATYTNSALAEGETLVCVLTASGELCLASPTGTSSVITMTVNPQPAISLGASPVVTTGTNTANLPYSGTTGSPDEYSITFDSAAHTAGFSDVSLTGLPTSPISVPLGTAVTAGTYNGTLTVVNSTTGCSGSGAPFTVTILPAPASGLPYTNAGTFQWTCPDGVTSVQVECWGGGGAGGSGLRTPATASVQYGGGGAGGAYAKLNTYPVTPGNTYYINVGAGGVAATGTLVDNTKVPGGDSWFNSASTPSSTILAKGGDGGETAVGNTTATAYGVGGTGTTTGSIGDVRYAGGSGGTVTSSSGFGGSGGGSAGTAGNGISGGTNGLAAAAVTGGGPGGMSNPTNGASGNGQIPAYGPGGGGGGCRATTQKNGGNGYDGQVILTWSGGGGCVAAAAAMPVASPGLTVCANQSITLIETPGAGTAPFIYAWKKVGSGTVLGTTNTYVITSPVNGDQYTCDVTATCGGATSTSPAVTLTVNPLPGASVNSEAICAGGSAILTTTTGASSPTYVWSPGGATTASITVSPSSTTTYTVTVTDGVTGCANSGTGTVTVNPLPSASVNSETICLGGSATLNATSSASSPSYAWSPGGATTASITVSPASTTTYTVAITDGITGCANSGSGTVTVSPIPGATITAPGAVGASSTNNAASVPSAGAGASYVWGITGGTIDTGNGTDAITFTAGASGTVGLTCGVTNSAGCGESGSASLTIWQITNQKTAVTINGGNIRNGNVTLTFWGVPGTEYTVRRAAALTGPWTDLTPLVQASTNSPLGQISYNDTNAPTSGAVYYRLKP